VFLKEKFYFAKRDAKTDATSRMMWDLAYVERF